MLPLNKEVGKFKSLALVNETVPASASMFPFVRLTDPAIVSVFAPISKVPDVNVSVPVVVNDWFNVTPALLFIVKLFTVFAVGVVVNVPEVAPLNS